MASDSKEQLGADLSAYLDGELGSDRAREIERLLERSEDARRLFGELRSVSQGLSELPRVNAPSGLAGRISEGRTTPASRVPSHRLRRLNLIARIVASAAVIVICMYTGWILRDRTVPEYAVGIEYTSPQAPISPDKQHKGALEKGAAGVSTDTRSKKTELPAVAMRELESLGYVDDVARDENLSRATGETSPPKMPDAFAAVEPPEQIQPVLNAMGTFTTPRHAPTLSIVVQPRNLDEYESALQVVAAWNQQVPSTEHLGSENKLKRGSSGKDQARRMEGVAGGVVVRDQIATAPQEIMVQMPSSSVGDALQALEQQSPRQVQVSMMFSPNDISQIQQLFTPQMEFMKTDESPAEESAPTLAMMDEGQPRSNTSQGEEIQEPADSVAHGAVKQPVIESDKDATMHGSKEMAVAPRGGRGSRGRIARQPAQAEEMDKSGTDRKSHEGVAAVLAPDLDRDDAGMSNTASKPRSQSQPAKAPRPLDETRQPTVAQVAKPTSQLEQAVPESDEAATGRQYNQLGVDMIAPANVEQLGSEGQALQQRLRGLYDQMMKHNASEIETSETRTDSITLHITVLPPPQTTQPSSAPVSTSGE